MQSKGNIIFSGLKRLIGFGIIFSKDAVYCISFVLFDSKASRDKTFVSIPLNDWSNIHNYIIRHEVLSSHIAIASQQTATHFLDIMSKDGVHYFNSFVSPQRGYCQKQTHCKEDNPSIDSLWSSKYCNSGA